MRENKERYKEWCEKELDIPIYSQPWWMDSLCGKDNWEVFLVGEGRDIKASFVYYYVVEDEKKRIKRALLTQNNGIYIHYPSGQGIIAKQKYEENIIDEIIDYIESLDLSSYDQQYNWKFQNWLPFFWRFYNETVKYTYVIDKTCNMEEVRDNYSSNVRKLIKKAKKNNLLVESFHDTKEFYRVNKLSFDRQNIDIPYSYEQFKNLHQSCVKHKCTCLLRVVDDDNNIHAVAMLVWDKNFVYFLLNGTDPQYKSYQGNYLLIDECISVASKMNLRFDFEGSVIRSVNHAFRDFGGTPQPYFRIYKDYMK